MNNLKNSTRVLSTAVLCCFVLFLGACTDHKKKVKEEAEKWGKSLIDEDFTTFVNYVPSDIYDELGGKDKMIAAMKESNNQLKLMGLKILSCSYEEPSEMIEVGENELQCTITQSMIMQVPEGKMENKSTVIAMSKDKGETWAFFDSNGMSVVEMREVFPTLSSDLVIQNFGEPKPVKE